MTQQQSAPTPEELNDLFQDESTIPTTEWIKFTQIGDAVQGVLVEEPQSTVSSKFGTPQMVYTLQTAEGDMVLVGLNPNTNVRAVRQLKQAEVGDTVAIKLVSFYDSGKGNPGRNYDIRIRHANPTPQQEAEPFPSGTPVAKQPVAQQPLAPKTVAPATAPMLPVQKLARIIEIAQAKLGAVSDDDAKAKVMEVTKIPLIESRYDEILALMEAMAKV